MNKIYTLVLVAFALSDIALSTKDALMEEAKADALGELCVLVIDPEKGN